MTSHQKLLPRCPFCGAKGPIASPTCPNVSCGISLAPRLLVDWEIEILLERHSIVIEPLLKLKGTPDAQLGPTAIDLRLDTIFKEFKLMNRQVVDVRVPEPEEELYRSVEVEIREEEPYILHPGEFVL